MNVFLAPQAVAGKPKKKLLDQVRDVMRLKHYSLRTERTYCDWIARFIRFHQMRHPGEMREAEMSEFLTHLARSENVSASTQNQALSALLFLYKEVLKQEIGWLQNVERAKKSARLPIVLTRDEVHKLFSHLRGTARLMAGLLYGSGLRLMECVRLRVKDVDFGYARITVRDTKSGRDRVTPLPVNLEPESIVAQCYGMSRVDEEYYCNFGLNPAYRDALEEGGLRVTGRDDDDEARVVVVADRTRRGSAECQGNVRPALRPARA